MSDLLATMLADVLAATVAVLDDPPARQLVNHGGTFAHDCAMCAVRLMDLHLQGQTLGPLGPETCKTIPVVQLQIVVLRDCWPVVDGSGTVPSAAAITAASSILAVDAWALTIELNELRAQGALMPNVAVSQERVVFTGLVPQSPEAGLAGWTSSLSVYL